MSGEQRGGNVGKRKGGEVMGGNMTGRMGKGMSGEERENGGKEVKGREWKFGRNMAGRMGKGMNGEERGEMVGKRE